MKRTQTTLIAGLLLLGVSSVQANPVTKWFSSLHNNAFVTAALEKAKSNRAISTVVAVSATLAAAYGVYAAFFKQDELEKFRKTAPQIGIQYDILQAIDSDVTNIENAHIPRMPHLFANTQLGFDKSADYRLAFQNKDTKAMKNMAIGLLKAAQKMNIQ